MPASQRIARYTSGVEATTYPPMMIITISMVKGTSAQKFLPSAEASFEGLSCNTRPVTNTKIIRMNANISGSGNQRSLQCKRQPKADECAFTAGLLLDCRSTWLDGIGHRLLDHSNHGRF